MDSRWSRTADSGCFYLGDFPRIKDPILWNGMGMKGFSKDSQYDEIPDRFEFGQVAKKESTTSWPFLALLPDLQQVPLVSVMELLGSMPRT